MQPISLETMQPSEFDHYTDWLHDEASDTLFGRADSFPTMGSASNQLFAWKVLREGAVVAIVLVAVDTTQSGHVSLIVKQEARRQGVGSAAIRAVITEPAVKQLRNLFAVVPQNNTGAQKILTKNGFARTGYDSEGYLEFRL